jgi:hypothetical protein
VQLVAAILSMEVPPLLAASSGEPLPPAWTAALERALEKSPGARFPSMVKLIAALRNESPVEEPRPGESRPGELRPGESRPGESRPGESRPGESRPEGPQLKGPMQDASAPAGSLRSESLAPGARHAGDDPSDPPAGASRSAAVDAKTAPGRARRPSLAGVIIALVALAAAAALAVLVRRPRGTEGAPAADTRSSARCDPVRCAEARAVCGRAGACVPLAPEGCEAFHEPEDLRDARTLWLGAMLPTSGTPEEAFGRHHVRALELARRDFVRAASQLRPSPDAPWPLRIAFVACDDRRDAQSAAHHLTDTLRVPAVIGFRSSGEAVALATGVFLPEGVLTLAALNMSPLVTEVAHPPGPRLLWRTTYNAKHAAHALARLLDEHLEPSLRARGVSRTRVYFLRNSHAAGDAFADVFTRALVFNGKSAMENDLDYRERSSRATTPSRAHTRALPKTSSPSSPTPSSSPWETRWWRPSSPRWRAPGRRATRGPCTPRSTRFPTVSTPISAPTRPGGAGSSAYRPSRRRPPTGAS